MQLPIPDRAAAEGEVEFLNRTFDRLFPICRSITGAGLRESLDIFAEFMPLKRGGVASGTSVFDWTVPDEWVIRDAFLEDDTGKKIVDFKSSNLSVVNYSTAIDRILSLEELEPHLHSIESLPDAIPYVTSYYKRTWGFCLPHAQRQSLRTGKYRAFIDAEHIKGRLDYGHAFLPGDSETEILISSYLCHPSLANNELSGPLVLALLWRRLQSWKRRRFTYRFVLNPETIGSVVYLSQHADVLRTRLEAGFVLTCLGGPEPHLSFKHSRRENTLADRLVRHCCSENLIGFVERPFAPEEGSDERQYCSPGFNLPVGQFARTVYGQYDGYHNSLDDKNFMGIDTLIRSADQVESFLHLYEYSGCFVNQEPYCEPQLGKRGLYPNLNSSATRDDSADGFSDGREQLRALLHVLNYSDGEHSVLDIASRLGVRVDRLIPVIKKLERAELLVHQSKEGNK